MICEEAFLYCGFKYRKKTTPQLEVMSDQPGRIGLRTASVAPIELIDSATSTAVVGCLPS